MPESLNSAGLLKYQETRGGWSDAEMSQTFRLLSLLPETGVSYGVLCFPIIIVVVATIVMPSRPSTLDAIPTVGSTSRLGSWWAGFRFLSNGIEVIQQGYGQYNKAPFKVAAFLSWIVVLSSHEHVEELRRAPDDTVSFDRAAADELQIDYTMDPRIHQNSYHVSVTRTQLTRNVGTLYSDLRNEITTAFDDTIDLKGNEWKSIPALSHMQRIVCRVSNRVFVGLPLCRDPDWIDLNIQFTLFVAQASVVIRLFPEFLKPLAARFLTRVVRCKRRARNLIGPIIEERRKYLEEYGKEWADKPNDCLSWLMDEAEGVDSTVESLTTRVLVLNFTAIHTSASSFTHALIYLAANPQYMQPLREEVETIIREEGWSKSAVSKMHRVDSFLKECQRREGHLAISLLRKTLKDFTLSDGTILPKGTMIVAPSRAIHYDETYYPNADAFQPFRFSDMLEKDVDSVKHQFVSTTAECLGFGHGQHACPGRFFAAIELKTMLAHVVLTYDVKLEDGATHPKPIHIGTATSPDPNAKVMFRTRVR